MTHYQAAPGIWLQDPWRDIDGAPVDEWILLGFCQQGDEMPIGLRVGIGYVSANRRKIFIMNGGDNEKGLPAYWMPLPPPPCAEACAEE